VKKLPPAEKQQGKELYQQWRGKLTELRGVLDIFVQIHRNTAWPADKDKKQLLA